MTNVAHIEDFRTFDIDCCVRVVEVEAGMKFDCDCCSVPSAEPLLLSGEYTFRYSYPLRNKAEFKHELQKDISAMDLLKIGRSDYERIYREEDEDVEGPTPMIPGMLNRQHSNGRWGIWGHVINDLFFEGISIDPIKREVTFAMGS